MASHYSFLKSDSSYFAVHEKGVKMQFYNSSNGSTRTIISNTLKKGKILLLSIIKYFYLYFYFLIHVFTICVNDLKVE